MNKNIEISIDKLILHGFSHVDRHRIGYALENELTRLISEQGIPSALSTENNYDQLDGGNVNISNTSKAEITGRQIAQSVYTGFTK